jgi:hypothetical protein
MCIKTSNELWKYQMGSKGIANVKKKKQHCNSVPEGA